MTEGSTILQGSKMWFLLFFKGWWQQDGLFFLPGRSISGENMWGCQADPEIQGHSCCAPGHCVWAVTARQFGSFPGVQPLEETWIKGENWCQHGIRDRWTFPVLREKLCWWMLSSWGHMLESRVQIPQWVEALPLTFMEFNRSNLVQKKDRNN